MEKRKTYYRKIKEKNIRFFLFCICIINILILNFGSVASSFIKNNGYIYLVKGIINNEINSMIIADKYYYLNSNLFRSNISSEIGNSLSLYYRGFYEEALNSLIMEEDFRDNFRRILIVDLYDKLDQKDKAKDVLEQMPDYVSSYYYIKGYQTRYEDYQDAIKNFEIASIIDPSNSRFNYELAYLYWRRIRDNGKAYLAIYQALSIDDIKSDKWYFYEGLLCYFDQEYNCAISRWKNVVRLDETSVYDYLAYEMYSKTVYEGSLFSDGNIGIIEQGCV